MTKEKGPKEKESCPYNEMLLKLREKFYVNNCVSDDSKDIIKRSLTHYGLNLKESNGNTLESLIIKIIENANINDETTLRASCEKMMITLQNKITKKKETLAKSLYNNKVQFKIENDKLVPQSERTKWLMSFIDVEENVKLDESRKFSELEAYFDFNKLAQRFSETSEIKNNKQIKSILQKHCNVNWQEKKDTLSDEIKKEFSFYANEVSKYFAHYFPFSEKRL